MLTVQWTLSVCCTLGKVIGEQVAEQRGKWVNKCGNKYGDKSNVMFSGVLIYEE